MKTILLLNDKGRLGKPRVQNVAGSKVTVRPGEGSPGCNCDRWGHPCPDCIERNVQPNAALPVSRRAKQMGSFSAGHQQA